MESIELEEISTGKKAKKCVQLFPPFPPRYRSPGTYYLHTYCKKKCVQLFSKMSPFPLGYGSPGDLHSVRKNVSNYFQRCHHFPHGLGHRGPTCCKKKGVQLFLRIALFASCVGGQEPKFFKKNFVQL